MVLLWGQAEEPIMVLVISFISREEYRYIILEYQWATCLLSRLVFNVSMSPQVSGGARLLRSSSKAKSHTPLSCDVSVSHCPPAESPARQLCWIRATLRNTSVWLGKTFYISKLCSPPLRFTWARDFVIVMPRFVKRNSRHTKKNNTNWKGREL